MSIAAFEASTMCATIIGSLVFPIQTENRYKEAGLEVRYNSSLELITIAKGDAGFTVKQVAVLRNLIRDVEAGQTNPCKFLVFDFQSEGGTSPKIPADFDPLIQDLSNLIFEAPVISIAWARGTIAGADLELALSCSMMVGEVGAGFSFDVDLGDTPRSYSLLAHKIGFVQAERLMDSGTTIDAAALHDLMLLNALVPVAAGVEGIETFVGARARRHNSACGIYRAQRIAMSGASS